MGDKDHVDRLYEHRDYLTQSAERSQSELDRTLVTIATAAIGVTLVILKDFVGATPARHGGLLLVSWTSLLVSLATSIIAMAMGTKLAQAEISAVDRQIEQSTGVRPDGKRECLRSAIVWTNRTSILSLLLGITLVVVFAYVNLPG